MHYFITKHKQHIIGNFFSIQHHDGDVSDLCLTFSWDEDFMGKVHGCYI